MVTIASEFEGQQKRDREGREHQFFFGMSLLIALVFFIGFAKTYFLAGLFDAKPLPAPIVHVHGAVFTSWIVLLVVQTSLAAAGHTKIHRQLGLVGVGLAPLVFVLGVLVAHEMLERLSAIPGAPALTLYAVALSEVTGFALPVFCAFRLRRWPAYHKRLIMVGTIAMTTAGFGRWPVHFLLHKPLPAMCCTFGLLALLAAYDVFSLGKIHRVTALGSAWIVSLDLLCLPLSGTLAWHAFASWSLAL